MCYIFSVKFKFQQITVDMKTFFFKIIFLLELCSLSLSNVSKFIYIYTTRRGFYFQFNNFFKSFFNKTIFQNRNFSKSKSFYCYCSPSLCDNYNCSMKPINRTTVSVNVYLHTVKDVASLKVIFISANIDYISTFFINNNCPYRYQVKVIVNIKPLLSTNNNYNTMFKNEIDVCSALKGVNDNLIPTHKLIDFNLNSNIFKKGCPMRAVSFKTRAFKRCVLSNYLIVCTIQDDYYVNLPLFEKQDNFPSIFPTGRYQIITTFFEPKSNQLLFNCTYIKDITNNLLQYW